MACQRSAGRADSLWEAVGDDRPVASRVAETYGSVVSLEPPIPSAGDGSDIGAVPERAPSRVGKGGGALIEGSHLVEQAPASAAPSGAKAGGQPVRR